MCPPFYWLGGALPDSYLSERHSAKTTLYLEPFLCWVFLRDSRQTSSMPITHRVTPGRWGNTRQPYVRSSVAARHSYYMDYSEEHGSGGVHMRERRDRERDVGIESLMYWSQLPFIRIEFAHAKHQLMDLRDFIRNFKWPESPSTFNNNKAFCYTGGSSPRPFLQEGFMSCKFVLLKIWVANLYSQSWSIW